jgi:spermidine/putrescine transport system ATP-binding protein
MCYRLSNKIGDCKLNKTGGALSRGNSAEFAVEVQQVVKHYGSVKALENVNLTIRDNEFFTMLGPSGCGKTTLLRVIAGFESVTSGRVFLFGNEIENLPPNKRPVNTVFQQYALFPHMTVSQNVAFGLLRLKHPKAEVETRVQKVLDLVQLSALAERRPSQLSGGQQQRVALARALAPEPKVLLLDEPLSALDLKLRQAMRGELKSIQEEAGITFIFVTHDQEEALTMSDRIAVMSDGQVQQIGSAREIYEQPRNRFVADFIGETNLLDVKVEQIGKGVATCRLSNGKALEAIPAGEVTTGTDGHVSIRPEQITLYRPGDDSLLEGVVDRLIYLGSGTQHLIKLTDGAEVIVRSQSILQQSEGFNPGDTVGLCINPGAVRLLVD